MARFQFLYLEDSRYEDRPWEVYQFPAPYLSRASQMVGDWFIYLEPVKAGRKGYHAVAKVDQITPDSSSPGMYLEIIGSPRIRKTGPIPCFYAGTASDASKALP